MYVSRLIEQWDELIKYFQAVVGRDNLLTSQKILSLLKNPIWKLYRYFYFLDFVLPKFTELNVMFQGRVVQKAISANSGLKFNRLFILVCSA